MTAPPPRLCSNAPYLSFPDLAKHFVACHDAPACAHQRQHHAVFQRRDRLAPAFQDKLAIGLVEAAAGSNRDANGSLKRGLCVRPFLVRYESKKTGRAASTVKKAVKKIGNARKRVEKRLAR